MIDVRGGVGGPITNMLFHRSIVRCLRDRRRRRDAAKVMSRLTREGVGFLDLPLHPSLPPSPFRSCFSMNNFLAGSPLSS